jgi:hypothetical protein
MRRALRNLFRLLAAGLVVFGAMGIGLEFIRHRLRGAEIRWTYVGVSTGLTAAAIALFATSDRMAARLSDDADDADDNGDS